MIKPSSERLAELIGQRLACLVQMRKVGIKQMELVATGEISALLSLLAVKNQLIVALQAIEQELKPYHSEDPNSRVWLNEAARERCATQNDDCQRLLDEIMQMECENEKRMIERRDQVASQLQATHSATTARRAYQAHQRHGPRAMICDSPHASEAVDLHVEA